MASRFWIDIEHEGLGKFKRVTASSRYEARRKAEAQLHQWDEQWERRLERQAREAERESAALAKAEEKARAERWVEIAELRTKEAEAAVASTRGLLAATLSVDDRIDWNTLLDKTPFPIPRPVAKPARPKPTLSSKLPDRLREPTQADFEIKPSFLDKLLSRENNLRLEARKEFRAAHADWETAVARYRLESKERFARESKLWEEEERARKLDFASELEDWRTSREQFLKEQKRRNEEIYQRYQAYKTKDDEAIVEYFERVLNRSEYPDFVPSLFEVQFDKPNSLVIASLVLPSQEDLPSLKKVNYVKSRGELREFPLSDSDKAKLFRSVAYQIAIRTIHEIIESDAVRAAKTVAFNGLVHLKALETGQHEERCIMSVQVERSEFLKLDLQHVDPEQCFRGLGGKAAKKLEALKPISAISLAGQDEGVQVQDEATTLSEAVALALYCGASLPSGFEVRGADMRRGNAIDPYIKKKYRGLVFAAFGNRCVACQSQESLDLDHLWWPKTHGGNFAMRHQSGPLANVVPLCSSCNSSKQDKSATEYFEAAALRSLEAAVVGLSERFRRDQELTLRLS